MIVQNIFQGRQFVLELPVTTPFKEKQNLKNKITQNNGVFSYVINSKTYYLVVGSDGPHDSYRCRMADKYGAKKVTSDFIDACIEHGKLLDFTPYAIASSETLKVENKFTDGIVSLDHGGDDDHNKKYKHAKLSKQKVWLYKDPEGSQFHQKRHVIVKAVLLVAKVKPSGQRFCQIELHVSPNSMYEHFSIFTHKGVLPQDYDVREFGCKECMFFERSTEALSVFEQLYRQYLNPPHTMTQSMKAVHPHIGSEMYRIKDWLLSPAIMDEPVGGLMNHIWREALHKIEQLVSIPLKNIKDEQIDKAESLLLELAKTLESPDQKKLNSLAEEFFSTLPFKDKHPLNEANALLRKQWNCQLLRDTLQINEGVSPSDKNELEAVYHSLACDINCIDPSTDEAKEIVSLFVGEDEHVSVTNVFKVYRSAEQDMFAYHIENKKLLFHGTTVENVMGILSRGMLLPSNLLETCGSKLLDAKNSLGCGLYFSDSLKSVLKYSTPGITSNRRLVIISEVALGQVKDMYQCNYQLTEPPEEFQSIRGVGQEEVQYSEFEDNEYVIYKTNQQRIKYIIEFHCNTTDERVAPLPKSVYTPTFPQVAYSITNIESDDEMGGSQTLVDHRLLNDLPQTQIQAGLQSLLKKAIPLKSVHIRAKVVDLAAEVVVMQEYFNDSDTTFEARYVFPLDDKAAVCAFEAVSDGLLFVGRIEEKQQAQKEYKEAVHRGQKAFLMDEEAPDVFRVSIGNIKPRSSVFVKIKYVVELDIEGDLIKFKLPGSVSPWDKEAALGQQLQSATSTVDVSKSSHVESSVEIFVEMPYDIKRVSSTTHNVEVKKTASQAVVQTQKNERLDTGFDLLVSLAEVHRPRMWVENSPDGKTSACMLTFYPEFMSEIQDEVEVILAIDSSNSMGIGDAYDCAKQVALLCLHNMEPSVKFNVVQFGSIFNEAFPCPKEKSVDEIFEAQQFIGRSKPVLGSSNLYQLLKSYFHLPPTKGTIRNIFLISDGYLTFDTNLLHLVAKHNSHTRLFTLGVGPFVNSHKLAAIAHAGGGAFESFPTSLKSKWNTKAKGQLLKSSEPVLTDVKVEWQQFNEVDASPLYAPKIITALFSGSRLIVYGLVQNCSLAILKAKVHGTELSTVVYTSELHKSTGLAVHRLTARAITRDWDSGLLHLSPSVHGLLKSSMKSKILELSKQYSIVTPLSSFVAIEDKDDKEKSKITRMSDFVQTESVDFLSYLEYSMQKKRSKATSDDVLIDCIAQGKRQKRSDELPIRRQMSSSNRLDNTKQSEAMLYSNTDVSDGGASTEVHTLDSKQLELEVQKQDNQLEHIRRKLLIKKKKHSCREQPELETVGRVAVPELAFSSGESSSDRSRERSRERSRRSGPGFIREKQMGKPQASNQLIPEEIDGVRRNTDDTRSLRKFETDSVDDGFELRKSKKKGVKKPKFSINFDVQGYDPISNSFTCKSDGTFTTNSFMPLSVPLDESEASTETLTIKDDSERELVLEDDDEVSDSSEGGVCLMDLMSTNGSVSQSGDEEEVDFAASHKHFTMSNLDIRACIGATLDLPSPDIFSRPENSVQEFGFRPESAMSSSVSQCGGLLFGSAAPAFGEVKLPKTFSGAAAPPISSSSFSLSDQFGQAFGFRPPSANTSSALSSGGPVFGSASPPLVQPLAPTSFSAGGAAGVTPFGLTAQVPPLPPPPGSLEAISCGLYDTCPPQQQQQQPYFQRMSASPSPELRKTSDIFGQSAVPAPFGGAPLQLQASPNYAPTSPNYSPAGSCVPQAQVVAKSTREPKLQQLLLSQPRCKVAYTERHVENALQKKMKTDEFSNQAHYLSTSNAPMFQGKVSIKHGYTEEPCSLEKEVKRCDLSYSGFGLKGMASNIKFATPGTLEKPKKQTTQADRCSLSLGNGLPFGWSLLKIIFEKMTEGEKNMKLSLALIEKVNDELFEDEWACQEERLDEDCDEKYTNVLKFLQDCCDDVGIIVLEKLVKNKKWNNKLWNRLESLLDQKGIRSMGTVVRNTVLTILATLVVEFAILEEVFGKNILPLQLGDASDLNRQAHETLDAVEEFALEKDKNPVVTLLMSWSVKALLNIIRLNERHPLVYFTLELGNSWEEAFQQLTKGEKLIKF